ncbi:hypothetical protein SMICM17S_04910 [Streptomyces microflavus]
MALRHAVLAALLDDELSGYQLAKRSTWPREPAPLQQQKELTRQDMEHRPPPISRHPPTSGCPGTPAAVSPSRGGRREPPSPRSSGTTCSSRSRRPTTSTPAT